MPSGTLRKWRPDEGYGFIVPDGGGRDVFVHVTTLQISNINPESLRVGERFTFSVDATTRPGKIQACKVRRLG